MPSNNFENRVFGSVIIKSVISNYNADFTHQPRTLPSGTFYATDKALKYTIKHYFKKYFEDGDNNRVMYFRNYDGDMKPRSLGETYKVHLGFKEFPKKEKANTKEEYFLFHSDGTDIKGFIPSKPPKKILKEYWDNIKATELDSLNFKARIDTFFKNPKAKKLEDIRKFDDVKKLSGSEEGDLENNEQFFFINNNNEFQKIEVSDDDFLTFKETVVEIDNLATGGYDKYAILKNLLKCIDVRLFGATFADETNISIHGSVQVNHGLNVYPKSEKFSEQIMSPFRNSNEKSVNNDATTLGSQFQLEEGHYVHHFSINPYNLSTYNQNLKGEKDEEKVFISTDDIDKLKAALKNGATDYDSASKKGTENELLIWVQLKSESKLVLPNFTPLITVAAEKNNGKSIIDITKLIALLTALPLKKFGEDREEEIQIEKIEIGYNPHVTEIIGIPDNGIQGLNIIITGLY